MSSREDRAKPREVEAQLPRGAIDPQRMAPEEYLERYGMTAYVKDVMTLLLENRPEKPLEFIHDYLSNALQGRTQVVRAFRYIRLTKRSRQAFIDNLASAYAAMARSGEAAGGGLTGAEYLGLLKLLCDDFPAQIVASLVQVLDRRATGVVSFAEFAAGVNACLLYEEFLEHAERLFHACDIEGSGRVDLEVFMAVVRHMNRGPAQEGEGGGAGSAAEGAQGGGGWTIPSLHLIESCNALLAAEGAGAGATITYKDFVMTIVKIFIARGHVQ